MATDLKYHQLFSKWQQMAQDDYEMALAAQKINKKLYCMFHLQQCFEKILKGMILLKGKCQPPYLHSLNRLLLELEKYEPEIVSSLPWAEKFFEGLDPYYIHARYPSYKQNLANELTDEIINHYFIKSKELLQWFDQKVM